MSLNNQEFESELNKQLTTSEDFDTSDIKTSEELAALLNKTKIEPYMDGVTNLLQNDSGVVKAEGKGSIEYINDEFVPVWRLPCGAAASWFEMDWEWFPVRS